MASSSTLAPLWHGTSTLFGHSLRTNILDGLGWNGILAGKTFRPRDSFYAQFRCKSFDREWAILIPSWIMVAVVFVYIAYFALNLFNTPALDSLTCISDTQGHLLPKAPRSTKGFYAVSVGEQRDDQPDQDYIPPLYDLPVGLVNRAVFG